MTETPQPETEPAKATDVKPAPDSEHALAGVTENPPAREVKPMPGDPNAPHDAIKVKPDPS